MKKLALLSILAAVVVAVLLLARERRTATPEEPSEVAASTSPVSHREVVPIEVPRGELEARLLRTVEALVGRVEELDRSVRELKDELAVREAAQYRMPVGERVVERALYLQRSDLEDIGLRVRNELVDEAWRARQEQLVVTGRWLANEVPLRTSTLNPLIEAICAYEKQWFHLERRQADVDHDEAMARKVADDQRRARIGLHRELRRIYGESELVARLFLHVASHGEVRSLQLPKDELFEVEKLWL